MILHDWFKVGKNNRFETIELVKIKSKQFSFVSTALR